MAMLRTGALLMGLLAASGLSKGQTGTPAQTATSQSTPAQRPIVVTANQTPDSTAYSVPVLKATTRTVVVDVVVGDNAGRPVSGLNKSDFALQEDGRAQSIAFFEAATSAAPVAESHLLPQTILLIDELNAQFEDFSYARFCVRKLLQQKGPLNQLTALMVLTDQGLKVLQDYTRDPEALERALQNHHSALPWRLSQGVEFANARLELSLGSLDQIAWANRGSRTRNNVVWISPGFPLLFKVNPNAAEQDRLLTAVRRISDHLTQARITVYTVDPQGPLPGPRRAAPRTPRQVYFANFPKPGSASFGDLALQSLALDTGGRAFYGRNDVDAEVASSISDGDNYYTLSYYPSNRNFDGKFREIKVNLARPGLLSRTRNGYYALPEPSAATVQQATSQLESALLSPLSFTNIPINGTSAVVTNEGGKEQLGISVDARAIRWEVLPNGDLQCKLQLGAADFSDKGMPIHFVSQAYAATIPSAKANDVQHTLLQLSVQIEVASQPVQRFRIAVFDLATGFIGTAEIGFSTDHASDSQSPSPSSD